MGKSKSARVVVRLWSQAGTGYQYNVMRKKTAPKMELRKYDPHVRKHVLFAESKPPPLPQ